MAAVTVRNLSAATHRALRLRAARHNRSTEAEIRAILDEAARPAERVKLGSALVDAFRARTGDEARDEIELDIRRDDSPVIPIAFE